MHYVLPVDFLHDLCASLESLHTRRLRPRRRSARALSQRQSSWECAARLHRATPGWLQEFDELLAALHRWAVNHLDSTSKRDILTSRYSATPSDFLREVARHWHAWKYLTQFASGVLALLAPEELGEEYGKVTVENRLYRAFHSEVYAMVYDHLPQIWRQHVAELRGIDINLLASCAEMLRLVGPATTEPTATAQHAAFDAMVLDAYVDLDDTVQPNVALRRMNLSRRLLLLSQPPIGEAIRNLVLKYGFGGYEKLGAVAKRNLNRLLELWLRVDQSQTRLEHMRITDSILRGIDELRGNNFVRIDMRGLVNMLGVAVKQLKEVVTLRRGADHAADVQREWDSLYDAARKQYYVRYASAVMRPDIRGQEAFLKFLKKRQQVEVFLAQTPLRGERCFSRVLQCTRDAIAQSIVSHDGRGLAALLKTNEQDGLERMYRLIKSMGALHAMRGALHSYMKDEVCSARLAFRGMPDSLQNRSCSTLFALHAKYEQLICKHFDNDEVFRDLWRLVVWQQVSG